MAKKVSPEVSNKIKGLLTEKKKEKANVGLYLDKGLKETIQAAAKSHGTTFNKLVVKILSDFFKEKR